MCQQITAHLWQVAGSELTHPADAAAYVVRFGQHAALFDAGSGAAHDRLKANIDVCLEGGTALDLLLLTHCHYDHTGGAEAVRHDYGAAIAAHELDAVYLENGDSEVTAAKWYGATLHPFTVDQKISGEENKLPVGDGEITAIHWPGHSPGSVVYTTQVDGHHILIGQDVHGPIHPSLLSDHHQYQRSLQKLLEIQADLLLEGHFGIIRGQAAIEKFIRSFMD